MSTKIPYLDEVWSPMTGCSGKNCAIRESCWAYGMMRFPVIQAMHGERGYDTEYGIEVESIPFDEVQFHPDRLDQPLHWKKARRVGVCFLGDLFDDQMKSGVVEWEKVMEIINVMWNAPQHQYFILTKQPQNMLEFYQEWMRPEDKKDHIWWGTSYCTQPDFDEKVLQLLQIPGKKWISAEPLMERLWFGKDLYQWASIDLVIVGCHSNPRRYPCKLEWVESVVDQCRAVGIPVYVKQIEINGKCVQDFKKFPTSVKVREL